MRSRALITGINGFAGRYLADCLSKRGYEVFGTAHHEASIAEPNIKVVDVRDGAMLSNVVRSINPSHIIHLAAVSFVAHDDIGAIYETNIVGTRNLLEAAKEQPDRPSAILLVSSANVYGDAGGEQISEETSVNPLNDYAVSKIAMEHMARQYTEKLPIVVARPFNYTGVGQSNRFLVAKIVEHFKQAKEEIELGNLDVSRDFSDVRTVAEYFARLIESPEAIGQVFNICSGSYQSVDTILKICERLSGRTVRVLPNKNLERSGEIKILVGSAAKLERMVGKVQTYSFEQTLEWMLNSEESY